ncbi:MAG: hypothetical protein FJ125_03340 [Deltaproteobacteria bacterium]|nr:hypothetical protein [Deltaproteobacteria bacterium]
MPERIERAFCLLAGGLLLSLALPAAAQEVPGCQEHATQPVRICFTSAADERLAGELLDPVGEMWQALVVERGFTPPWRLAGDQIEEGLEIQLAATSERVSVSTTPVAEVAATRRSDCAVRTTVNSSNPSGTLTWTIGHELVHASSRADDCVEAMDELAATYVGMICTVAAGLGTMEEQLVEQGRRNFSSFQTSPFFALDYTGGGSGWGRNRFRSGAALFAMYLDQRWGAGDGGLIAELLVAGRQDGIIAIADGQARLERGENEPDLLDAVDSVPEAGDGDFWVALEEFSIWRALTAERADGDHLAQADLLPPVTVERGTVIYFDDTLSIDAGGYTSPIDFDETTPHLDCLSYIVLDETAEVGSELTHTLEHEFCHTTQMAMDCAESLDSMEATATWITFNINRGRDQYFELAIRDYQAQPEKSLGWSLQQQVYPYGAAVFIQYSQEYLGDNDPQAIPGLWEGSVQEDRDNEPDLLDAIVDLAREKGLTRDQVVLEFAQWRYFVGRNDDGEHFARGADWRGGEVAVNGDLPLGESERLSRVVDIQPLGTHLADLSLGGEQDAWTKSKVIVSLTGRQRGVLELWDVGDAGLVSRRSTLQDDGATTARLVLEGEALNAAARALLVLFHLPEQVDWDDRWADQSLHLEVELLEQPLLAAVEPRQIVLGQSATVTLRGRGFGANSQVQLSGTGLVLGPPLVVSDGELQLTLTVDRAAGAGTRDVVVANVLDDLRLEASLAGGIELVPPPAPRLDRIVPDHALPGDRPIVRLDGEDLAAELEVRLGCPGLAIERRRFIDERTLYLYLVVASDAAPGSCELAVTDSYGQQAKLVDAFRIDEAPAQETPDAGAADAGAADGGGGAEGRSGGSGDGGDDGGCSLARRSATPSGAAPALSLVMLGWLVLRRSLLKNRREHTGR